MYEITEGELSVEEVASKVGHPSCGAITIFVGTVRDVSRGRKVLYLEYEAFKEMAERKLAEIGESIRTRWGLDRVAITHRVGRLDLGEASVVIAVASPHRAEAFEACRHAIETLKKTVPIWKKEVWEGGEMWVGMEGTDDPETE
ncbi:MAG TPA: molybdenum cofactor biosynthesis protein MoaE [Candidatus Methylomirabilis sp.]|nr:molybdenum cofactor biosynthesis protein MoaE [Candidatus Methylomirabilis sp.]